MRHHDDARPILPKAAFFLGDTRDGLPMLNLQAVFLVSACHYSEKQIGILFLSFGLAQTLCMAPIGYVLDYSGKKVQYAIYAALLVSFLTIVITAVASFNGHMSMQILLHILQGLSSSVLPTAFNGITLGITGQTGLSHQVSRNRMMNHFGTATLVGFSCITAYYSFPNFQALFVASPLAAILATYYLRQIPAKIIHRDAARGLIRESPTMEEYCLFDDVAECKLAAMSIGAKDSSPRQRAIPNYQPPVDDRDSEASDSVDVSSGRGDSEMDRSAHSVPSFRFGWTNGNNNATSSQSLKAVTPARVLSDPLLRNFVTAIFFFHLANSSVLPLVMQSLALHDEKTGILLSGLCILIAQFCMSFIARWSGDRSAKMGRKPLVLLGFTALTIRCFLLTALVSAEDWFEDYFDKSSLATQGTTVLKGLVVATQFLDSLGAGVLGTLQILVTSDIAEGSGRFSFLMGITTSAVCFGATVSGYLGQAIAQDYGYEWAFTALGVISLIPLVLYSLVMPETLPDFTPAKIQRRQRFRDWWKKNFRRKQQEPPTVSGMAGQGRLELV